MKLQKYLLCKMQSKNTILADKNIHHMHTNAGSLQTIFNMTAFVSCGILVPWTGVVNRQQLKKNICINATRQCYKSKHAITKKNRFEWHLKDSYCKYHSNFEHVDEKTAHSTFFFAIKRQKLLKDLKSWSDNFVFNMLLECWFREIS